MGCRLFLIAIVTIRSRCGERLHRTEEIRMSFARRGERASVAGLRAELWSIESMSRLPFYHLSQVRLKCGFVYTRAERPMAGGLFAGTSWRDGSRSQRLARVRRAIGSWTKGSFFGGGEPPPYRAFDRRGEFASASRCATEERSFVAALLPPASRKTLTTAGRLDDGQGRMCVRMERGGAGKCVV